MRRAMQILTVLAFATTLYAADPFVGTWKLNTGKSNYTKGAPPKEETIVIAEAGGQLEVTIKGVASDGSAMSTKYTMPSGGGVGKMMEGPYDDVSGKIANFYTREVTYSKGGKEAMAVRAVAAKDKRSMRVTILRATDSKGQPVKGVSVFDKQ